MMIDIASEQLGPLSANLGLKIKIIQSVSTLKNLARQAVKLDNLEDFLHAVERVTEE